MKHITSAGLIILVISLLISCSKNADAVVVLSGKWSIIYDSAYAGVGADNHPIGYLGKTGDYFDFRNDGKLYTSENDLPDTLNYQLVSASEIIIKRFKVIADDALEVNNIIDLTNHGVIISTPVFITPGGILGRKVKLKR